MKKKALILFSLGGLSASIITLAVVGTYSSTYAFALNKGEAGAWVHYAEAAPGTVPGTGKGIKEYWVECGGNYTLEDPGISCIEGTSYDISEFTMDDPRWIDHSFAASTVTYLDYSNVYELKLYGEMTSFNMTFDAPTISTDKIRIAYKIVDPDTTSGAFYEPSIGGHTFQWTTYEGNAAGWANVYDTWYETLEDVSSAIVDGKIAISLGSYLSRPFASQGASVYIAVSEPSIDPYTVTLDTEMSLAGYSSVYRIDVNTATAGFSVDIKGIDTSAKSVKLAYRIDNGGNGIYIWPQIGGVQFQFTTNEENAGGWCNIYGQWYETSDSGAEAIGTLNSDGSLTANIKDFQGNLFAAGAKIYIAVSVPSSNPYTVTLDTEMALTGYSSVYRIDLITETAGFSVDIEGIDTSAKSVKLAYRIDNGGNGIYIWPEIGGAQFEFTTNAENAGGWCNIYGQWYEAVVGGAEAIGTLNNDGSLTANIKDYQGNLFAEGAKIYIAVEVQQ